MPYLTLSSIPQSCGLSLDYLEILSPVDHLFRQISLDLILVFINIPLRYIFFLFKGSFHCEGNMDREVYVCVCD